jgi:hypothetical protein
MIVRPPGNRALLVRSVFLKRWAALLFLAVSLVGAHPPRVSALQVEALSGWLIYTVIDGPPGSGIEYSSYVLTDDHGRAIELDFAQDHELIPSGFATRAAVSGNWISPSLGGLAADRLRVSSVTIETSTDAFRWPPWPPVGSQKWLSILCTFPDSPAPTLAPSFFSAMYVPGYPSQDHYWREVSYDLINLIGSGSTAWYTLPNPKAYYMSGEPPIPSLLSLGLDCIAQADNDVYLPTYTGLNLVYHGLTEGMAMAGGYVMNRDGVEGLWYVTHLPDWGYTNHTVVAHEMGHIMGFPHSLGRTSSHYENQWDVMSDTWSNCSRSTDVVYGCLAQHPIARNKDRVGWIPASAKYIPGNHSHTTIHLEQVALPAPGGYLIAQIPILGSTSRFYTLEARRQTGYDVKLPGEAVIIHEVDLSRQIPARIVDWDDTVSTGDSGAMWLPGEVFTDPRGITVTIVSATQTGFMVTIEYDPVTVQIPIVVYK